MLADAKDYSSDLRWLGYLAVGILAFVIGGVSLVYLLAHGPTTYALTWGCLGSSVVLLLSILTFHSLGVLSYAPLKVYDEGVEIQDGSKRTIVEFEDIKSLNIYISWSSRSVSRECEIKTISGKFLSSKGYFSDKKKLAAFIDKIQPILKEKGFSVEKEEDRRYLGFKFMR